MTRHPSQWRIIWRSRLPPNSACRRSSQLMTSGLRSARKHSKTTMKQVKKRTMHLSNMLTINLNNMFLMQRIAIIMHWRMSWGILITRDKALSWLRNKIKSHSGLTLTQLIISRSVKQKWKEEVAGINSSSASVDLVYFKHIKTVLWSQLRKEDLLPEQAKK